MKNYVILAVIVECTWVLPNKKTLKQSNTTSKLTQMIQKWILLGVWLAIALNNVMATTPDVPLSKQNYFNAETGGFKEHIQQHEFPYKDFFTFENSANIFTLDKAENLIVSKDYGVTWEIPHGLPNNTVEYVEQKHPFTIQLGPYKNLELEPHIRLDTVYSDSRAYYVAPKAPTNYTIYYTTNAGESWSSWDLSSVVNLQLSPLFPKRSKKKNLNRKYRINDPRSSITNPNHLLMSVTIADKSIYFLRKLEIISYNMGETWEVVTPIKEINTVTNKLYSTKCDFGKNLQNQLVCLVYTENSNTFVNHHGDIPNFFGQLYINNEMGAQSGWTLANNLGKPNVLDFAVFEKYTIAYTTEYNHVNSSLKTIVHISYDNGVSFQRSMKVRDWPDGYDRYQGNSLTHFSSYSEVKENGAIIIRTQTEEKIGDVGGLRIIYFISESDGKNFKQVDDEVFSSGQKLSVFLFIDYIRGLQNRWFGTLKYFHPNVFQGSSAKVSLDNGRSWKLVQLDLQNTDTSKFDLPCTVIDDSSCILKVYDYFKEDMSSGVFTVEGTVLQIDLEGQVIKSSTQTFITRDGGLTFAPIFNFKSMAAIGNQGNILVVAPSSKASDSTSEIYYSLDQGNTWITHDLGMDYKITEIKPMKFDGIGTRFLVKGKKIEKKISENSNGKDTVFKSQYNFILDFSNVHDGTLCDEPDFETWDINEGQCIENAKHFVKRRKQHSSCFVEYINGSLEKRQEEC